MNVLDALENELGVGIESFRLVALATSPIGHGVNLWPRVHDVKEVGAGIHIDNATDVLLVLR